MSVRVLILLMQQDTLSERPEGNDSMGKAISSKGSLVTLSELDPARGVEVESIRNVSKAPEILSPSPCYSLSEYGRLLFLLKDYEHERKSFRASKKSASKAQMDSGVSLDEFWTTMIEKVFNDDAN